MNLSCIDITIFSYGVNDIRVEYRQKAVSLKFQTTGNSAPNEVTIIPMNGDVGGVLDSLTNQFSQLAEDYHRTITDAGNALLSDSSGA